MRISLVTPSYNQVQFLEPAMRSVIGQNQDIEYIVVDGGSTDGSVSVIEKLEDHLAWWVSEPDRGQYDALNKGFNRSTGDVMGWLNSDDLHTHWCLSIVDEIFSTLPEVEWLTTLFPLRWDARGRAIECVPQRGFDRGAFLRGENLSGGNWYASGWIQQESTFWRRSLWEKAGAGLDLRYGVAADFELWARFFQFSALVGVAAPLAGFRQHGNQRSLALMADYKLEAIQALAEHGGRPGGKWSSQLAGLANHLPLTLKKKLHIRVNRPVCVFDARQEHWLLTYW